MELNIIQYENKEALNINSNIPNKNKVTHTDLNEIKYVINNLIFPIGTIIKNSRTDFDPNLIYGGTWELLKGMTLYGYDPSDPLFNVLGSVNGSNEIALTANNIPKLPLKPNEGNNDPITGGYNTGGGLKRYLLKTNLTDATSPQLTVGQDNPTKIKVTGKFKVVNIWERIA